MANVRISQLPAAPSAITGSELVPVVQNGQTVQTTVNALISSPSLTQTFLTKVQEPTLPNSRYLGVGAGLSITDAGAQNLLQISPAGALASLVNSSTGIQVKTDATTLTNRSIATSGNGLSISNGSGVSGDPTLALSGLPATLANTVGTGLLAVGASTTLTPVLITGESNEISVANGDAAGGSNPLIGLADNPIVPGSAAIRVPTGTTAQRPGAPANGDIRYNTDTGLFEGYLNGGWSSFAAGSGVTSVATGTGLTGGPITSTGTISIANTAVTAGSYGSATQVGTFTVNEQGQLTAAANASITAGGIGAVASVSGTANEITASGTTNVTLSLPAALTFTGKTVTGGTLTGVAINGSTNTLSNIANSSLTNSSITLGTTTIALGGTSLTPAGLTSVTVTQDPTSALQLATKQYVDAVAEGLHIHESCAAATPATLASITGGTVTYNNGTAGVGATLTLSVPLTILDGYTLLNTNRILVKNEATQANNGIYTWATGGTVLTRATDFDTAAEIASGDFTFVTNGTLYASTGWVQTNPVTTVGSDAITWVQFTGAGTYTAGTGLTLTGTQFSITNTAVTAGAYGSATQVGTFTVNAQGQLTLAGNTSIAIDASQVTSGTLALANGGTASASAPQANATLMGWTTTATAGGTTTLTNASSYQQNFTGSSSQTVVLPVTSTLALGWAFEIINNSSGSLTVNSSGGNLVGTITAGTTASIVCSLTSGTTAASWDFDIDGFAAQTGTGDVVRASSPSLSSPSMSSPSATGTLGFSGSTSSTAQFATSQTTGNTTICSIQTSGTLIIGGASGTGTQTIGRSTVSQTTDIQAGATASGSIKTMNIGTGGLAGSTTTITIGASAGTSTTTVNGTLTAGSGVTGGIAGGTF